MTANLITADIISHANPLKAKLLQRFFKTNPGEYAEGDLFLGLTVPQSRAIAKKFKSAPLSEIKKLLSSKYHEVRLVSLLLLTQLFQKSNLEVQTEIYNFYLASTKYINNWDLVDLSAPNIVGEYLLSQNNYQPLIHLTRSDDLWERRIAILATFAFLKHGNSLPTYKISDLLLQDRHDLIHKAVGWLLRESGKRVSHEELCKFLETRAHIMPRTMLRYSLEHFPPTKRQHFMSLKFNNK